MDSEILIIGVGNSFRHDDSAGIEVARQIRRRRNESRCLEMAGEGTRLMEAWGNETQVILVDAVTSNRPPGTIHRIRVKEDPIPKQWFSCSTHNFGVAEAVEMATIMGTLPPSLEIIGIEGKCFEPGEGLCPEVMQAVDQVVQELIARLGSRQP